MITLEEVNVTNWLAICNLSVSEEQKKVFPIPNVYWIGISRYEEFTTLFAIKKDNDYVGLIGVGYDEDGVSGYINPLMIDVKYQGKGYSSKALELAIHKLQEMKVPAIHIGHRKSNKIAEKLYEKHGFRIVGEDEQDYFRELRFE